MIPVTQDAHNLLLKGAIALSQVEANGLRVDAAGLENSIRKANKQKAKLHEQMAENEVGKVWMKKHGKKTKFGDCGQLGGVLFNEMGFEVKVRTEKSKKPKVDEETLSQIKHPIIAIFLKAKKLDKAISTYLNGIQRETVDGYLHPFFNLHTTITARSSSDNPNFQNFPKHNKPIMELIRSVFIPREGRRLVEMDYSGMEVKAGACYHKDKKMLDYLNDPTTDMHRDAACNLFNLHQDDVTKNLRQITKGGFVFAQFYGSWYVQCAVGVWKSIQGEMLADGASVVQHLREQGITSLGACKSGQRAEPGTFEAHTQRTEKKLWKRFSGYASWKDRIYKQYQEDGYVETLTGFVLQGHMTQRAVCNYPIQGSAFHCLLWSLIYLQKALKDRGMKTLIVGQIHDSILADVPENEMNEFLLLAEQVMCVWIKKAWPWIIAPLEVDAEGCGVGGNWSQNEEIVIPS